MMTKNNQNSAEMSMGSQTCNISRKSAKIFSAIVALLPWLSIYATAINGVTIADLALICFIVYEWLMISLRRKNLQFSSRWLMVLFTYLIISTMLRYLTMQPVNSMPVIFRITKFGMFCLVIISMFPGYLDKETLYRWIRYLALISCVAIIIQYIAHYTIGSYLEFKIPFLSYSNERVNSIDYMALQSNAFRPSSIFLEPAHFAMCSIIYVVILLFQTDVKRYNWIEAIGVSICLVLSTSSTALVLLIIVWTIYSYNILTGKHTIYNKNMAIVGIAGILILVALYFRETPQLYQTLERILDPNNTAVTGRINAGDRLVQSLSGIERWIGVGFGNLTEYIYMNSINYMAYCAGYIGSLIALGVLANAYMASGMIGKITAIIFFMLCFSSPIIISVTIIVYGAIFYVDNRQTVN